MTSSDMRDELWINSIANCQFSVIVESPLTASHDLTSNNGLIRLPPFAKSSKQTSISSPLIVFEILDRENSIVNGSISLDSEIANVEFKNVTLAYEGAYALNDVCVLLAGRAAKIKIMGPEHMDSGAVNDLSQASLQVYAAITTLGMDKEL